MITISDKAASEIKRVIAEQNDQSLYLRVRVIGGGCSGYEHKLDLDTECHEGKDTLYEVNGVKVVIDKRSVIYLDGASVDFQDDLNKRGFVVTNPNARNTCGCGKSFSM